MSSTPQLDQYSVFHLCYFVSFVHLLFLRNSWFTLRCESVDNIVGTNIIDCFKIYSFELLVHRIEYIEVFRTLCYSQFVHDRFNQLIILLSTLSTYIYKTPFFNMDYIVNFETKTHSHIFISSSILNLQFKQSLMGRTFK